LEMNGEVVDTSTDRQRKTSAVASAVPAAG
jgi:hypothetical protein